MWSAGSAYTTSARVYTPGPQAATTISNGNRRFIGRSRSEASIRLLQPPVRSPAGNTGRDARHTVGRRYVWAPMDNLEHTLVRGALAMARPVHGGGRAQSPLSRLAGVVRPAAVPPLERALVLR